VTEFRWCAQPFWHKARVWRTDRETDRRTVVNGVAYTRYSIRLYAVSRKKGTGLKKLLLLLLLLHATTTSNRRRSSVNFGARHFCQKIYVSLRKINKIAPFDPPTAEFYTTLFCPKSRFLFREKGQTPPTSPPPTNMTATAAAAATATTTTTTVLLRTTLARVGKERTIYLDLESEKRMATLLSVILRRWMIHRAHRHWRRRPVYLGSETNAFSDSSCLLAPAFRPVENTENI